MKRQSNIVAAALTNYERLDEILQTSQGSMGSAMREQAEYAKSIEYSIGRFKTAYQELSQTIMKSDFLKGLIETGVDFLGVLNDIVEKFGAIPPLLMSIAAVRGLQGKGKLTEYAYLRTIAFCA